MDHKTPFTFAIIGGGLTATSALCQLVDQLIRLQQSGPSPSRRLTIVIIEKNDTFGPGLPHNEEIVRPFHITNMCAEDMSVRLDHPGDFAAWVQQHPETLENISPGQQITPRTENTTCHHYPRAIMGEYLKQRFNEAVETARGLGIEINLHRGTEVTDLIPEGPQFRLHTEGTATTHNADAILLATGHWFETSETRHYIPSPWPARRLLNTIPDDQPVGILGSSLSAIEVALTLTSNGRFTREPTGRLTYTGSPRHITLLSRNGLLPRVRGRIGRRRNRHLTCEHLEQLIQKHPGKVPLNAVFELLNQELNEAYGAPFDWQSLINPDGGAAERLQQDIQQAYEGDGPDGELIWQTVLVEIFPVVRALYLNLPLTDRQLFDQKYNTLFFMHAATQPIINAEKMLALIDAGIVSIVRLGDDYRLEHADKDGPFIFTTPQPTSNTQVQRRLSFPYLVNACGQPRSIETNTTPLFRNLQKRQLIQTMETRDAQQHNTGSILIDPGNQRIIPKDANQPPLYAVGAMTRGQMIDASMAHGLIRSTAAVATDLLNKLH